MCPGSSDVTPGAPCFFGRAGFSTTARSEAFSPTRPSVAARISSHPRSLGSATGWEFSPSTWSRSSAPSRRCDMRVTLYLGRDTVLYRLHPQVKLGLLAATFASIYGVDRPVAVAPVATALALLLVSAQARSEEHTSELQSR